MWRRGTPRVDHMHDVANEPSVSSLSSLSLSPLSSLSLSSPLPLSILSLLSCMNRMGGRGHGVSRWVGGIMHNSGGREGDFACTGVLAHKKT